MEDDRQERLVELLAALWPRRVRQLQIATSRTVAFGESSRLTPRAGDESYGLLAAASISATDGPDTAPFETGPAVRAETRLPRLAGRSAASWRCSWCDG